MGKGVGVDPHYRSGRGFGWDCEAVGVEGVMRWMVEEGEGGRRGVADRSGATRDRQSS